MRLQTFTRFVEVGRVVLINYGENKGKICTVIDIVDAKRVSLMINVHNRDYIDDQMMTTYDLIQPSKVPRTSASFHYSIDLI